MYNSGRGDGSVQFFQYGSNVPGTIAFLGKFSHGQACKSFCLLPKWSLDPNKHEVGRSCRFLADNSLDYISFRLPNRTGVFQEELYPPFMSNEASNNFESWNAGTDNPVKTMQLRPGEVIGGASKSVSFQAKSAGESTAQAQPSASNAAADAKVAEQAQQI